MDVKKVLILLTIVFILMILIVGCDTKNSMSENVTTKNDVKLGNEIKMDLTQVENLDLSYLFVRPRQNTEQDIIDKYSVTELIEAERFFRDNSMWDEMKDCYADDSMVTVSWFQGNGKDFVDASSELGNYYSAHKLNNTIVWLNQEKAVAITNATIQLRFSYDGYPAELNSYVKLLYRVQRIENVWYVKSLDAIYEKDILIPVYPNNQIVLPVEEVTEYRSSYPNLSYIFNSLGLPVDQTLPGIDKAETVNILYKVADDWLSQ